MPLFWDDVRMLSSSCNFRSFRCSQGDERSLLLASSQTRTRSWFRLPVEGFSHLESNVPLVAAFSVQESAH